MGKITVIFVDDHDIVVLGVKALLSGFSDIKLVAVAKDGEEALEKIKELSPDVAVMDIDLPNSSGIDITQTITEEYPDTKVIIHSAYIDENHIVKGFECGAMGYVPKNFTSDQLVEAIRVVSRGEHYIKGFVSEILLASMHKDRKEPKSQQIQAMSLSTREIEVLSLVTQGFTNQEVADKLFISVRTVEAHKANIMKKLKIDNIAELVIYAIKNNIIRL